MPVDMQVSHLLEEYSNPNEGQSEVRINYDGFCQVRVPVPTFICQAKRIMAL